jgi:signal transduction histidine kinase
MIRQRAREHPPAVITGTILKIFIPLFLFAMSLLYFKHIYFRNLLQLERANKELSIAQEEKGRILNTVAHDLRSPVSTISGICHVMLADSEFTPEQKEWVFLVQQASDQFALFDQ